MVRKLKYHEQKLLKKVDFISWEVDQNLHEVKVLRRFHIEKREDYTKYNKLSRSVRELARKIRDLGEKDGFRAKCTSQLLNKLSERCSRVCSVFCAAGFQSPDVFVLQEHILHDRCSCWVSYKCVSVRACFCVSVHVCVSGACVNVHLFCINPCPTLVSDLQTGLLKRVETLSTASMSVREGAPVYEREGGAPVCVSGQGVLGSPRSSGPCSVAGWLRACLRRLPTIMVKLRMAQNLKTAITFIEQGHVRVGPEIITDPAFLVTRNTEDFVTWVDSSKIKQHVMEYNEQVSAPGTEFSRNDSNDRIQPVQLPQCHLHNGKLLKYLPCRVETPRSALPMPAHKQVFFGQTNDKCLDFQIP
ncbi:IMP3 protein, partial [Polyodon spathula]|nr:IMP3 protein [Polyodon spathula]